MKKFLIALVVLGASATAADAGPVLNWVRQHRAQRAGGCVTTTRVSAATRTVVTAPVPVVRVVPAAPAPAAKAPCGPNGCPLKK